tara:strand:+ start:688 stop:1257 length:570 start_codon:yes stop_codon:yes gene_type:complete
MYKQKKSIIQGTDKHISALKDMDVSRKDAYSSLPDDAESGGKGERHGTLTVNATGTQVVSSDTRSDGTEGSASFDLDASIPHHKAILDQRWKQGNSNSGGTLNSLVKTRNTYTKGTQAWVDAQNKINKSLGSNKVHTVTVETPRKEKKMLKKEKKAKNKVAWGKGERNIFGVKKDKSKRNKKTWWNPWD